MRLRWLARLLLPHLKRLAASRDSDFKVFRNGGEAVYLHRWWMWRRNNLSNLYLHNMLRDDDPILHDHPYGSISLVLTDGLTEVYRPHPDLDYSIGKWREGRMMSPTGDPLSHIAPRRRTFRAGDIVYRSSTMAHQLIVEPGEAWTLFFTFRRARGDWGFWCPKGWREWYKYVATNQDPSKKGNTVGRGTSGRGVGCGEP